MENVKGYIEKIVYRNEENGYTVMSVNADGEEITCVGIFHYIGEGEYLELQGEYIEHPSYGEQLSVKEYEIIAPEDEISMIRYLGSGAIKGVKISTATKIVNRFKKDTFRIMEEEPERLAEIKGISLNKAKEIAMQMEEKKVKEYIENEIASLGLQDYVSQVLVPAEKVYQVRNGKKYSSERNLYPGYVLIEAALVGEIPHILRDITNVIGFLGETKGGDPVPMRQAEVNRILGTVDELAEQPEEISIPYFVGESVKVTDGPFNGFTGVIEEVNSDKKRLKVIVKIFGRKTPLELSFMQVEKE